MSAVEMLGALAGTGPIRTPVALVVAHQDDEMIAAGGSMARLLDLTLIHITNGAMLNLDYLRANGFSSRAHCAAVRRAELDAALESACVRLARQVCYDIPDGEVARHEAAVMERLAADLMSVEAVITHPYEGGHVDHDACARAVHDAVAVLRRLTGRAPVILEFASYYHQHGQVRGGQFWADPECPEITLPLGPAARRRREAAFACFGSQAGNLRFFSLTTERFRAAPVYDFDRPPPPEGG